MSYRLFFVCLAFLLHGSKIFAQLPLDTLDIATKRNFHLTHYYKYLEDCNNFKEEEVLKNLQTDKFNNPTPKQPFNMGVSKCNYWLAIALKNSSADEKSITYSFYNNGLAFQLFELQNGTLALIDSSSMHIPLVERSFPVRGITFNVKFKSQQTKVLLVKIKRTTASNIYTPIDISNTNELMFFEIGYSYLIGKYIGYFLLALIANIILWIVLKNKLHFFLACYILIILGFILDEFHFDSMEFGGDFFRYWSYIHEAFFTGMALYFCSRVFILFTDLHNSNPRLFTYLTWYNHISLGFSTALLIISLSFNYQSTIYKTGGTIVYYYTIAGFFLLISTLLYGVVRKQYYAILYFLSSALLLAGFVSYIAASFKLGRLFLLRPGNIVNGLAFEITVLTFFFIYKYKKEKDELQRKIIESIKLKQELSTSLLEIQENERTRIAHDLHDEVGNTLNGLRLMTQSYFAKTPIISIEEEQFREQLLAGMKKINTDVREITSDLMPKGLESDGLIPRINIQLTLLRTTNTGVDIQFIHKGDIETIEPKIKVMSYRIMSELLQNTIKHSGASKATLQCLLFDETLQIIMEDNGKGFNSDQSLNNGIGMRSIKARVSYLNGEYKIDSGINGTTFIIEIPV